MNGGGIGCECHAAITNDLPELPIRRLQGSTRGRAGSLRSPQADEPGGVVGGVSVCRNGRTRALTVATKSRVQRLADMGQGDDDKAGCAQNL